MRQVNLQNANMRGWYFYRTNLQEANLEGAVLSGADLSLTNLRAANLRQVELINFAKLIKADLSNANLSEADLTDADSSGANLEKAILTGCILQDARFDEATKWPDSFDPKAAGAILISNQQSEEHTGRHLALGIRKKDGTQEIRVYSIYPWKFEKTFISPIRLSITSIVFSSNATKLAGSFENKTVIWNI